MRKLLSLLTANITYVLTGYFILQLLLLLKFPVAYANDSGYYFKLAQDCVAHSALYPLPQHLYEDYIIAPLYINVITLLLLVFNSSITIGLFNIVLNFTQLYLLFKITKHIAGMDIAKAAVILHMLYLNSLGMILLNLSDMFFTVLIMAGVYLWMLADSKSKTEIKAGNVAAKALARPGFLYFVSGFLCAASIAVRPVGWALALAYAVIGGIRICRKGKISGPAVSLAGFAGFVLLFGLLMKLSFGEPVFSSDNGPLNILIGANDRANGAYQESVQEQGGIGYIPNPEKLTYHQKQAIWKDSAIVWIAHHPAKWLMLMPKKIFHIFAWDDIAVSRLVTPDFNLYKFVKQTITGVSQTGVPPLYSAQFILWGVLQVMDHLFYYAVMFLFVFGLLKYRAVWIHDANLKLLLSFAVLGIAITITAFGDARYKYPYMFIIFLFDALFLSKRFSVGDR